MPKHVHAVHNDRLGTPLMPHAAYTTTVLHAKTVDCALSHSYATTLTVNAPNRDISKK